MVTARTDDDRARGRRLEASLAALLFEEGARARHREGEVDDPLLATLDVNELDEAAASVRRMIRERTHRGSGGLFAWYPRTITAWQQAHAADAGCEELLTRFCASTACAAWRDLPAGEIGISLEEALHRFFAQESIGEPAVRDEELMAAVTRGLAVTPAARFVWPAVIHAAPGGCFAVTREGTLHAALDGRYVTGPITPLVRAILLETRASAARALGAAASEIDKVIDVLRGMRLVP